MTQNTSAAVMQQRVEPHDSLDDFPTPPWATRAVIEHVLWPLLMPYFGPCTKLGNEHSGLDRLVALDPCCNRGHMVRPLAEYFGRVDSADVRDYRDDPLPAVLADGTRFAQQRVCDFLMPGWEYDPPYVPDWIFENPPFKAGEAFVQRSLDLAREGVAVFCRSAFTEGQERYESLFAKRPPTVVAQHSERVILHKGVLRDPAKEYWDPAANDGPGKKGGGGWRRPSTATSYCWLVWIKGVAPKPFQWIPPCRQQLERPGDYPTNPDERGVFVPPAVTGQGGLAL